MKKSALEIEEDIYTTLYDFMLYNIKGDFYLSDCRPFGSDREDAVLMVGNVSAGQIQEGRARINIYVQDIDNGSGRYMPNKKRLQELARLDNAIVEELNKADNQYMYELAQATYQLEDIAVHQHFVNINVKFKNVTF